MGGLLRALWMSLVVGALASAALAGEVVQEVRLGDTVIANLNAPGIDTLSLPFEAVAGTQIGIRVRGDRGLVLTLDLEDGAGSSVPLGDALQVRGSSAQIRRFEIATTGSYSFEIGSTAGAGRVQVRTAGRFPSRLDVSGSFPADDSIDFDVVPGSLLRVQIAGDRGATYEPSIDEVRDAGGTLALEGLTLRGNRASFRAALAMDGGPVTLELGGTGAGAYSGRIGIRVPSSRSTYDLTTLPQTVVARISGRVTNALSGAPLAALPVSLSPTVPGVTALTDADGRYSAQVPIGVYSLGFAASNFTSRTETVSLFAGQLRTLNVALQPVARVVVRASVTGTPTPGAQLTANAEIIILDGSTLQTIAWEQSQSVDVAIGSPASASTPVTLPATAAWKAELVELLSEPPVAAEELPPNVPLPDGEFPGGLPDRFAVVGINPFALERAGEVELEVAVTTSSGTYSDDVAIHATLPWRVGPGLNNVPVGVPVLLNGRAHVDANQDGNNDLTGADVSTYDWSLTRVGGAAPPLMDATSKQPWFVPAQAGHYTVEVTDTTRPPGNATVTLEIYAGTWEGVITGQDGDGRPLASGCTGCHNGSDAPDTFTPWKQTGHAEIFTDLLKGSSFYNPSCFGCHMVGFDRTVNNAGADDTADYTAFLNGGLLGSPRASNWTNMLASFPQTARKANVQCENCHGPQASAAHSEGDPRVSLSSDVCATCHGEPLRHARFQQWQLSSHANYELAIERAESGNCARCHTANGFLAWLPVLLDDDPMTNPLDDVAVTWTKDEIHPQTCVTCHDPHSPGSTSGGDTNAKVRVSGNTPLLIAGFRAIGVGKGAQCMTCHNSRRGLFNDTVYPGIRGTAETTRAPHGSVQADVLMGQNAYFVNTGIRGSHSLVRDTCVNCHMQRTPPPDVLAYNQGGTNHTFFASDQICSQCHGDAFDATGLRAAFEASLDELEALYVEQLLALMDAQIALGREINLGGGNVISNVANVASVEVGETRGRQAITVQFVGGARVGPVGLNSVTVRPAGGGASLGLLYAFADDRLVKSGWNWTLIHNDGSRGVHNPAFALQVLDLSIDALRTLAAES